MPLNEIAESHEQFRGAWSHFARQNPRGEVRELAEVFIAAGNVSWPILNMAFLREPVETEQALEKAVEAAARYFEPRKLGWLLVIGEDLVTPSLQPRVSELLGAQGMAPALVLTGMVAERLAPALRPAPALEVREVADIAGWETLIDINAQSYHVTQQMGREALAVEDLTLVQGRGYVGYQQGRATSCVAVYPIDGVAYVALVATQEAARRQGHAEAVIRHALAEAKRLWGLERTVLHATPAGYPLYLQMGYRTTVRFHTYMPVPPSSTPQG